MSKSFDPVERAPRARCLRILFVEDHPDSRLVTANLLRHCGYHVTAAECAATALSMLNLETFDVILSDIGLPDGSGDGLIMLAKQKQSSIVAIALSALSDDKDIQFSRAAGFDAYLTKPVDFHELRTVLNSLGKPKDNSHDPSAFPIRNPQSAIRNPKSEIEMPGRGLEPLRIAPPDPKSGASANFATLA